MKTFILSLLLLGSTALAGVTADQRYSINHLSGQAFRVSLGDLENSNKNSVKAQYDFYKKVNGLNPNVQNLMGGAVGDIGLGVFIPAGAIVDRVLVEVLSPLVGVSGSAPSAPPVGSPAFGTARNCAVLGASAVTSTGNTVLTGDLCEYPGTSVTGFPPGTFTGALNVANAAALAAKNAAQATYTDLQSRTASTIAASLDGQTLVAGVYKSAGGTFTLAQSGGGTLTLSGSATDMWIFQTSSTLITGAGGVPVINLTGGALASNVYWVVGSSATINSGSAGTFQGNVIAQTSVTDTLGGTVNGTLAALTGAVTLSAATTGNAEPLGGSTTGAGIANISVKVNNPGDLVSSKSVSAFSGRMDGNPVGLAATSIKISSASQKEVKVTIASEALKGGKFDVFVEYWFGNDQKVSN